MEAIQDDVTFERVNLIRAANDEIHMLEELLRYQTRGKSDMDGMENLNSQYKILVSIMNQLKKADSKMRIEQTKTNVSQLEKLIQSVKILEKLSWKADFGMFGLMEDALCIGKAYLNCQAAIDNYKDTLLKAENINEKIISIVVERVVSEQDAYDTIKEEYGSKYGYAINSIESLNGTLLVCIRNVMMSVQKEIDRLVADAKEALLSENPIELSVDAVVSSVEVLPSEIAVARYPLKQASMEILKDIGLSDIYQYLYIMLREQGNVLVETSFERIGDESIDAFVLAYVLKVIESFPLGAVNVHIFDRNVSYLYKRLAKCFQDENAGETIKRMIQLHTDIKDLEKLRDVTCEDIFKKTSVTHPDLYSVYENDRTDPFNFIIIRDGIVDGSGYASTEVLDVMNALSKPGDTGHKCGLRFLIINNSSSFEKNLTPNAKHIISQIKQNCSLQLSYERDGFIFEGKVAEVLCIRGNMEQFVQDRSEQIVIAANSKEQNYVSISEVAADKEQNKPGSIMYIPVGKSGNAVVELPFSCKDEDGIVAGQCIGYMAIGQSGSGKSSFFHSLVLNGCLKYSPGSLQFWLLDFKNGGASSKYSHSGLPHIKMIAENNKIDDALCLFQMVLEEMERRSKAFNKNFVDNIVDYNNIAEAQGFEYFPRIVIAIDEVQEIFREDSASVLQKLISSISTRMRSAGMHFVMVAQNLSDGKSYMLKDAFLPSATGRICFRVAADIPRDSGFEEEFIQRKQEITELKTGEAYVSYGKGTIKKVKMAFASSQEMGGRYFAEIRQRYPEYADRKPLVIGSKKRLAITSALQGETSTYSSVIKNTKARYGIWTAIIGEDVYRMSPLEVRFSQHENSSVMFLGSDKQIASSLCASIVLSLLRQNVEVHLFNADRAKVQEEQEEYEAIPHAFMYVCKNMGNKDGNVVNHKSSEFKDVLKALYGEFLQRQNAVQMAEDEDLEFKPLFLVINDLYAIESYAPNDIVDNVDQTGEWSTKSEGIGFGFKYDIYSSQDGSTNRFQGQPSKRMQDIMSLLVKDGWRYNLHVILAIKGGSSDLRNSRIASEAASVILFNQTEYADQFENTYYLKEMLKNISNDGEGETMAVWAGKQRNYIKIRPIIYKLSENKEKAEVDKLVNGE